MNLKKQIAVIVLALTATTSPVWSQDRQALHITDRPNPSGDVARYQNRGRLYNWSGYIVISGYHDLPSGRHLHRLWGPTW